MSTNLELDRKADLLHAQKQAMAAARQADQEPDPHVANYYRDQANMWARVALALKD